MKFFDLKEKYEGFSLVEMIITLLIIGMVMLIASTTLTTLIKISTISSNKTRVRTETEFVLELLRRTVRNSDPSDVYIFSSYDSRTYDPTTGTVNDNPDVADISAVYATPLSQNISGNEIHFRPYGYESWVCIGFFKSSEDENMGYILKTSAKDLWGEQESCFENTTDITKYTIVLNSSYVDIDAFNIAYTELSDGNYLIRFDIDAEPTNWYFGAGVPISRVIHRQAVVSTEGIVW